MAARTVTRANLSEAVYQEVGLSRSESAELVDSVLNEISDALVRGETIKLSSFGSFVVRQKGERVGRNRPKARNRHAPGMIKFSTYLLKTIPQMPPVFLHLKAPCMQMK